MNILTKHKGRCRQITTYPLGLNDSINVVKMNILCMFLSLPVDKPKDHIFKWNKCISRFVWGVKRRGIRHTKLQLSKDKEGMALSNPKERISKEYFHAVQLRHLIYLCNEGYVAWCKDIQVSTLKHPNTTLTVTYMKGEYDLNPVMCYTLDFYGIPQWNN